MIKTLENSQTRLVLDQKPGFIGWFLGGFVLIWIYISINILRDGNPIGWIFLGATALPLLFLSLVQRHTLILDATDSSVSVIQRTLYRRHAQVFELQEVGRAQIRRAREERRRKVILKCGAQMIEFGTPQLTGHARKLVKQINDWFDAQP